MRNTPETPQETHYDLIKFKLGKSKFKNTAKWYTYFFQIQPKILIRLHLDCFHCCKGHHYMMLHLYFYHVAYFPGNVNKSSSPIACIKPQQGHCSCLAMQCVVKSLKHDMVGAIRNNSFFVKPMLKGGLNEGSFIHKL